MQDVFTLLTLPQTSKAFSALPAQAGKTSTRDSSRSASPPRKIARLDAASDAASATSSRVAGVVEPAADRRAPIVLRVVGHPVKPTPDAVKEADYTLVRRTIRMLVTPGETGTLPATYDRIYRACRAAVTEAGKGEGLYDAVKMELERCVGTIERTLANESRKSVEWLVPFTEACAWFDKQVGLLQSLLAYLDTLYVAEQPTLPRIKQLAYTMFSDSVIKSARITQAIISGIADWLEWERTNRASHPLRSCIPRLVHHLRAHGLYADLIESTYITLTHTFYTKESDALASAGTMSAKDFLAHVQTRSKEELERAQEVLLPESVVGVQDTADNALLAGRLQWLAKDALESLMAARNDAQLKKMYKLFAKVGGLNVLSAAFKLYIQKTVKAIVTDEEHDDEMVPRLLDFKAFADKLVSQAFVDETPSTTASPAQPQVSSSKTPAPAAPAPATHPNRDFQYGLRDAFHAGFKARRNKPAEMIAKHLDKAMRRGQKGKRDEDFAAELDEALALYPFTDDNDVFRAFYQRALAKRLLLGRSASDDFERAVLKKLKEEYDPEFGTSDNMFTDLALSRDLMQDFLEYRRRKGDVGTAQKLTVMVLQRSNWPFTARKNDIDLPSWMQEDLVDYTEFYKKKHQGRKLDWDHALGTATLKARFSAGEKELSVSLYQAVILLLFNDETTISYADIKEQTRLDDAELQRTLQSLACGKKRVLRKQPPGKDVNPTDVFHFNADFTDPRYQVHINSIQSKETPEESKRTQNSIEADRKHALDAAIVRVMKAKKELSYEQLKTATIEAVKKHFVPEVGMIKQRIQGLVEQEYLRRDEDDMNKYIYVA
ncbi:Cullin-domain-containing protein [Trametes coccinea BRFM310]|uniref:Cullin-domain-containing protein n=1 Tax=Trametes coccinea (strain BRFM310) TaxID=1353009 RepID=A0A1Y2IX69_TRAC3|nr:Cullin-domain-containing protein [Trametes coccinea BRFM310]